MNWRFETRFLAPSIRAPSATSGRPFVTRSPPMCAPSVTWTRPRNTITLSRTSPEICVAPSNTTTDPFTVPSTTVLPWKTTTMLAT